MINLKCLAKGPLALASGDNFGTNNVDPDQARQSVKLIWTPSVRVRNTDTV